MVMSSTVKQYLDRQGVDYRLITHPRTMSLEQAAAATQVAPAALARAVVLKDSRGLMLAVLPVSHVINFARLRELIGRDFEIAEAGEAARHFRDCEAGSLPPFGEVFGLDTVVDDCLAESDSIYFEPGSHTTLVKVGADNFQLLQGGAMRANFSAPAEALRVDAEVPMAELTPAAEVKRRIEALYKLPPVPQMAQRILQLRNDPDADVHDLAEIVEMDPSLAAQVIRYATSPLFGFRGKVDSVKEAIARVLGFEAVLNMALGLAAGGSLRNPPDGPLGLNAFWRHATYSAALCQALARRVSVGPERPKLGMAYLAGLLHNFGFLLLGHLFLPEFFLLNRMVAANPETPITVLEKRMLGMGDAQNVLSMGHAEIGAWLMESWEMPGELIVSLREHHNPGYEGEYAVYARLVLISNRLLKRHEIGDAESEILPPSVLAGLGLSEEKALEILEEMMESVDGLDDMAKLLAA